MKILTLITILCFTILLVVLAVLLFRIYHTLKSKINRKKVSIMLR